MTEDEIEKLLEIRRVELEALKATYESIQLTAERYHEMFKKVVKVCSRQEILDSFFFFWNYAGKLNLQYKMLSSPDAEFIATLPKFEETNLGKFMAYSNQIRKELNIDTDPRERGKTEQ